MRGLAALLGWCGVLASCAGAQPDAQSPREAPTTTHAEPPASSAAEQPEPGVPRGEPIPVQEASEWYALCRPSSAPATPPPTEESAAPRVALFAEFSTRGPLSPDELEQVRDALAERLRRLRLPLLPLDEVRAAEALSSQSRRAADGPVCGRSPSALEILRRSHPNLVVAEAYALCQGVVGGGCKLSVSFADASGRTWDGHSGLTAAIRAPALSVQDWIRGVRRLGSTELQAVGTLSQVRDRLELYVSGYGEWSSAPRDVLDSQYDAPSTCLTSAPDEVVTVAWHMEVAADGAVSAVSMGHAPGSERLPACLREILAAVRFPPAGTRARRVVTVYAYRPLGAVREVSLRVHGPPSSVRAPLYGPSFFRAAQACHVAANDSRSGGTAMRATLRIGPDGVPIDVEGAVALAPAGTEAEFGSCMRDALRATAWPCPGDDAQATIDVLLCQEPVARRP